jgi:hypothetical protein
VNCNQELCIELSSAINFHREIEPANLLQLEICGPLRETRCLTLQVNRFSDAVSVMQNEAVILRHPLRMQVLSVTISTSCRRRARRDGG